MPLIQLVNHINLAEVNPGTPDAGMLVFPQPLGVDMAIWGACSTPPANKSSAWTHKLAASASECGIALAPNANGDARASIAANGLRGRLWLSNLVLYSPDALSAFRPGAQFSDGEVWLKNVTVVNKFGGGVTASNANLYVVGCTFASNNAGYHDGGALNVAAMSIEAPSTLLVSDSRFVNNSARNGGAIAVTAPTGFARAAAIVSNSAFEGNSNPAGDTCGSDIAVFYDQNKHSYPNVFGDSIPIRSCVDTVAVAPLSNLNARMSLSSAATARWMHALIQAGVYGAVMDDPLGLMAARPDTGSAPAPPQPQEQSQSADESNKLLYGLVITTCVTGGFLFFGVIAFLAIKNKNATDRCEPNTKPSERHESDVPRPGLKRLPPSAFEQPHATCHVTVVKAAPPCMDDAESSLDMSTMQSDVCVWVSHTPPGDDSPDVAIAVASQLDAIMKGDVRPARLRPDLAAWPHAGAGDSPARQGSLAGGGASEDSFEGLGTLCVGAGEDVALQSDGSPLYANDSCSIGLETSAAHQAGCTSPNYSSIGFVPRDKERHDPAPRGPCDSMPASSSPPSAAEPSAGALPDGRSGEARSLDDFNCFWTPPTLQAGSQSGASSSDASNSSQRHTQ